MVTAKFRANVDTVLTSDLSAQCERPFLGAGESTTLAAVAQVLS